MTSTKTNTDLPAWAVSSFEHEGKIVYRAKNGAVKHRNGHFVKGFSGNKGGVSSNQAQQILRVRTMCLDALETKGLPRIIEELQNDDLSARDLVAIVKFLAETSIPKQVEEPTEDTSNIPQIIISREAIDRAEELDKAYTEDSGVSGTDE